MGLLWSLSYICCCSVTELCLALSDPWTTARQASLSFTISQSLIKFMYVESMMSSNHHPVTLFYFCPQSFPASFPMSWLFVSGGQSIGASASASILSMNIQGGFPLGLTDLFFLLSIKYIYNPTWLHGHLSYGFGCIKDALPAFN